MQHRGFYTAPNSTKGWLESRTYPEGSPRNTYPRRASFSGVNNGLQLLLKMEVGDAGMICKSFLQGFRVLLHNPMDVPRLAKHYFRVPMNNFVTVAVIPRFMHSQPEVEKIGVNKRGCVLEGERRLQHFRHYTQRNCYFECVTNYTLEMCNCVSFYMPRESLKSDFIASFLFFFRK